VNRRLQPLRVRSIVLGPADPTSRDIGQDRAAAWQAAPLDVLRRIPKIRPHQRLRALEIDPLDMYYDHRTRQLALCGKARQQFRIDGDIRAPVDPQRLADTWDQEQQRNARILDEVVEAVRAVVAAPVRDQQGLL